MTLIGTRTHTKRERKLYISSRAHWERQRKLNAEKYEKEMELNPEKAKEVTYIDQNH